MTRRIPHNPESMARAKNVLFAVIILGVVFGGFMLTSSLIGLRSVREAKLSLKNSKLQFAELSRQSVQMRREDLHKHKSSSGLETFALTLSKWADARNVQITSLMPEGTPLETDVEVDGAKLGTWNAGKVRVKGNAAFPNAMGLLSEFHKTDLPIQLDSFSMTSVDSKASMVSFELVLTVYEKKAGVS